MIVEIEPLVVGRRRKRVAHRGSMTAARGAGQRVIIGALASRKDVAALGFILFAALALRLSYLVPLLLDPGFDWPDPDHYLMNAGILARDGWEWTFRVVRYEWAGRYFYLPPLYPVFLSLFSVFSDMAAAAQLGQLALGVASVGLVYELGRLVHSVRAGLVAASVYALWFPSVITAWFYQETLYVPLVLLAFVLYLRAASSMRFGLAGAAFGLAALTRSMPLYFLPLLLAVLLWTTRGRGLRHALAVALGFTLVVAPYSAALSMHLGEVTVIENHGGIILLAGDPRAEESAGILSTADSLFRSARRNPSRVASDLFGSLRSVLHVNGGRLLQSYIVARSETFAALSKLAAHVFGDFAFVASMLLAPFGLALARRRDASLLSALWIALNLALVALGGFAGPRLRAPFEPHLVVFASVAAVAGVRGLERRRLLLVGAVSLAAGAVLLPQIPRSLAAWPDYAIRWQHRPKGWRTLVRGSAGFNVRVRTGFVPLEVRARPGEGDPSDTVVEVRLGRRLVGREVLAQGEVRHLRYVWPNRSIAYVELRASSAATQKPRDLLVITRRPR
jgi:4-amino-4-deoxy-L-arabinose transferase-like glycosyltransferase